MDPNVRAAPLDNHILLFEHANFHGKHKHVFTTESDVTADSEFSGILHNPNTSSLAVLKGNWAFYSRPGLDPQTKYPPTLGPGGYPFVGDVQIADNELSSLQPVVDRPTVQPPPIPVVDQGVVLFQYQKFHGKHKHVVAMEPNLNADDDADFNDSGTQSFVIRDRQWIFYPDWNFQGSYPIGYRSPGEYDLPEEAGSISSLAPLV